MMKDSAIGLEIGRLRVLWWRYISFGLIRFTKRFYDGPNHVLTIGRLWVEWRRNG